VKTEKMGVVGESVRDRAEVWGEGEPRDGGVVKQGLVVVSIRSGGVGIGVVSNG
jgi:hypothetical protein